MLDFITATDITANDLSFVFNMISQHHMVLCKYDYKCCGTCARDGAEEEMLLNPKYQGFVYFHHQDMEKMLEQINAGDKILTTYIGFSSVNAAQLFRQEMIKESIGVKWGESGRTRMTIFVPRQRLTGKRVCQCKSGDFEWLKSAKEEKCANCNGIGVVCF